jgi:hypothetical protein
MTLDDNEIHTQYELAIAELSKHITRAKDGTFKLKVKDAQEIGMDPVVFADLSRSLEMTNRLIQRGEIKAEEIPFF